MKYICKNCGYLSIKSIGKCPGCNSFGTMEESEEQTTKKKNSSKIAKKTIPIDITKRSESNERISTNLKELDRVFGEGGILLGSYILLAGEPGVGKSTLALHICRSFCENNKKVLYISGEESYNQVMNRICRVNNSLDSMEFVNDTNLESIELVMMGYDLVVIDSAQTLISEEYANPGSPTTVRFVASRIMEVCKKNNITTLLIGHSTKDGNIAGPQTLSHLVDVVAYLEAGDNGIRMLRTYKNRFGNTDEVGIFMMEEDGLKEKDPTKILLADRVEGNPGSVLTITMEGKRPLLIEIQALAVRTSFGYPKRVSTGINTNRLSLLIAVLEKHAGIKLSDYDIYLNVVGGLNIDDRGVDLAICTAIASSKLDKPIPDQVIFGEVGLGGEIRTASNSPKRSKEAEANSLKSISKKEVAHIKKILSLI